jgi:hypothetical protein
MVLSLLLDHTNLAQCLGDSTFHLSGPSRAEAVERRAFDLQLPLEGNRKINIELKLNAGLNEHQIARQRKAADPEDTMWYLLLGGSAHCWREQRIEEHYPGAKRIDLPKLLTALKSCSLIAATNLGIEQLLAAYTVRLQQHEQLIYRSFEFLPRFQWGYFEWAAFYGANREREWQLHKSMESGNFWVCGLLWKNIDENVAVALEMEQNTGLCFKIQVKKTETQSRLRNLWYDCLRQVSNEKIQRPKRFGSGGWMTSAIYLHNSELILQNLDESTSLPSYSLNWDHFYKSGEEAKEILLKAAGILQATMVREELGGDFTEII